MAEKYMAVCRFCGQVIATDEIFEEESAAEEWASRRCNCGKAKRYASIENAKDKAVRIMSGLNARVEVVNFVNNMIEGVGWGWLGKASAKISPEYTVHITETANGKIKLKVDKKTSSSTEL